MGQECLVAKYNGIIGIVPYSDNFFAAKRVFRTLDTVGKCTKPLSLIDFCDYFGISEPYASRLFKKHLNMTATEYINNKKLFYACELIRNTNMNINEISAYLGYSDVSYSGCFSKPPLRIFIACKKRKIVVEFTYRIKCKGTVCAFVKGGVFMPKREFDNNREYIHIPISDEHPTNHHYIKIYDGEHLAHEFHIGVAFGEKKTDFYVALYLGNYKSEKVVLVCEDNVSDDFFDGLISGKSPEEEKILYKNLYREPTRQQIHFSPRCGWLNDPNGLFIKDGVMNVYFQHNPFGSRHGGVNVSWGHTISRDGVHFKECPDAIMPYNSKCHVASGSAFVDINDICKKGKGTIIAAYTALQSKQYCGRGPVTQNEGQMLLYSKDDGMTFQFFEKNPIIAVPDNEFWRDPKIFEYNGKLFAIVYEPAGEEKRTSFYISEDGIEWEKISEGEKFHECPDFFALEEEISGKKLWILCGGNGKYSIGTFENYKFEAIEQNLFLDYGDSAYAGQTFSNNPENTFRYYVAWLRDEYLRCFIADDYKFKGIGFNQGLSLICKLTLHKTQKGYRVFRTPHENLKKLRTSEEIVTLSGKQLLDVPGEYEFTLDREKSVTIMMNGAGFTYNHEKHSVISSNGKEYCLCCDKAPEIRIFTDRRSVEFFINNETVLSFFVTPETMELEISGQESILAKKYNLRSIWE